MILTAHQPAYIPWLGYFDKIMKSDIFIYLDSVQFEKNSFTNRNKIKTPNGEMWLTIPVIMKNHTSSTLNNTLIDNSQNWQRKHLNSIYLNYKKSEFFDEIYSGIEPFYIKKYDLLSDYCYDYLLFWLKHFNIKANIVKSSTLNINSKKSDLIFDLCTHFKTDKYFSGIFGKDYLDENRFSYNNIQIIYQNYEPIAYKQLWGNFISHLSIIDYAMNERSLKELNSKPNSLDILMSGNIKKEDL